MSEQGRRDDQVASSEKITALVVIVGLISVVAGVIWQAIRGCGS